MLYKLYQKQVEAWKELNEEMLWVFPEEVDSVLSSRHKDTIELLEAEIERKKGMRREKPKGKCMNLENHLHGSCFECKKIDGFNEAIDEDIAYLEGELALIKKEL